jgi:glycosyltransferase involved in cell wall biosynthesis
MVSVNCITYNHEAFITDAIESFLMQKTDFQYEILIHDDASTDGTADIIRKYEKQYPDLIKPICQTENQFSKGVEILYLNSRRAKGKYLALCEGDDYWVDPYKLQKQVDYMEAHPECSLCVHAAFMVLPNKKKLRSLIQPSQCDKLFTAEEVMMRDGGLFATNSMLYPARLEERPSFFQGAPVGDYPLTILLAMQGTVFYMNEFMSSYRLGVSGSWCTRMSSDLKGRITFQYKMIDMLNKINEYSNFKYNKALNVSIERSKKQLTYEQQIKEGITREGLRSQSFKMTSNIILARHFPILLRWKMYIKRYCFKLF